MSHLPRIVRVRLRPSRYGCLLLALSVLSCTPAGRKDPPDRAPRELTPPAAASGADAPAPRLVAPGAVDAAPDESSPSAAPVADANASPAVAPVPAVPPLLDETGVPLPQTDERPSLDSPSFRRRMELLVEGIIADDAELALPAFFPVEAYQQVKAIKHPEQDWRHRLVGAYARNIREYHKRLGSDAAGCKFSRVELREANVKFMKPGAEGNRLEYYRVLRAQLLVERPDGKELPFEITSMISWRGEWYVVHLHGFG